MVGRNVLMALVFGLVLTAVAGCQQGVAREDFDALKKHNEKLMSENAQIQHETELMKAEADRKAEQDRLAALQPVEPGFTKPAQTDAQRIQNQLPPNTSVMQRPDGTTAIRIDGSMVNFGAGKAALSPEGKAAMDRVAQILNRDFAGRAIVVEGHTDSDPIRKTANLYKNNWELGMKRSTEVVDYLTTFKGVDPKRVRATSYGENQPIADNGNSSGRAKNRRVEIVVIPQDSSALPTPTAAAPY